MSVRHTPRQPSDPRVPSTRESIAQREGAPLAVDREIESKADVDAAWIDRPTNAEDDFDVAAWYALEVAADHDRLCITECWYG